MRRLMRGFQHHPLIVLVPAIFRCVDDAPILKWRPWIDKRTLNVGSSAGRNLVQVHRDAQPIGVHSHVARAEYRVSSQLALDGEIPLRRLRIAETGIGGLLNRAAADLYELARGDGIGELEKRRAVGTYGVDVSVNRGLWITLVVVL